MKSEWMSTNESERRPWAWFGVNAAGRVSADPLRLRYFAAETILSLLQEEVRKDTLKTGFDVRLEPGGAAAFNSGVGAFVRLGYRCASES